MSPVEYVQSQALCWVVQMIRWGDPGKHSYVLGVYSDRDLAGYAGQQESTYRGGKYTTAILPCYVDVNRLDEEPEFMRDET